MNVHYDIFASGLIRYKRPVITLGTFDGVHLGHRGLIQRVIEEARSRCTREVVLAFHPHPRTVVSPDITTRLLTTLEERLRLFEEIGVEEVVVAKFDPNLAELEAVSFVREILIKKLDLGKLIIGYDHAFGKGRFGGVALLQKLSKEFGFDLEVFGPVHYRGEPISSSRIRNALEKGDFDGAVAMLGHSYLISGKRMTGKGRGRRLGFSTVNLSTDDDKLLPPRGVYAAKVEIGHRCLGGMLYIGTRPTFGESLPSLEVHLLDYRAPQQARRREDDNRRFLVRAERYVRQDRRFRSPEELVAQLRKDEKNIRELLKKGLRTEKL